MHTWGNHYNSVQVYSFFGYVVQNPTRVNVMHTHIYVYCLFFVVFCYIYVKHHTYGKVYVFKPYNNSFDLRHTSPVN